MSSATWSERQRRLRWLIVPAALGAAGLVFFAVLLWTYNWRPTVGTVILSLGWLALLGAGILIARAATATFNLAADDVPVGTLSGARRLELDREKKSLLKAIKEIEFDQGMGKIDDLEAAAAVARYRARALEILRLLDEDGSAVGEGDARVETLVEKELARRLVKAQVSPAPASREAETPFCARCGMRNDADAAFCKKCGSRLGAGDAS